jgi:hypothetical protein
VPEPVSGVVVPPRSVESVARSLCEELARHGFDDHDVVLLATELLDRVKLQVDARTSATAPPPRRA